MPTIMTHAVVAWGLGRVLTRFRRLPWRLWFLAGGLAMLPDLDVLAWPLGIPWGSPWAHRGLTHSLTAAVLVSLGVAALAHRGTGLRFSGCWGLLAIAMASHGALDALTDGGPGVAFLAPFDDTRYFFPWRPIRVSPLWRGFLTERGLQTLASEARWIGLPLAILVTAAWLVRRYRAR
ncbi:MAG TPA: metal-dependent hydrolase [Pseudomonadales bacterium]|nr:metal-dependent hydrolase [Pseudomonadales bacterium]